MWLTTADETQKLAPQPALSPAGAATGDEAVTIDPSQALPAHARLRRGDDRCVGRAVQPAARDKRRAIMAELFGRGTAASACRSPG
jgi:glucosylceramidase